MRVFIHYVKFYFSNLEKKHEIYTLQQYEESQKLKLEENPNIDNNKTESLSETIITPKIQEEVKKEEEKLFAASEIKQQTQKPIEAAAITTKIITKVENSTPPATPLNNNNITNNNNNSNKPIINNKINETEDIINIKPIIKQEQIPPTTTNNNYNNNKIPTPATSSTITNTKQVAPSINTATVAINTPLLLSTQQLPPPHCPTTTVTHTIFNKSKTSPTTPGPKTVTSSLILPNLPTTTSTQSILHQHHPNLNAATPIRVAPQSVTASVFSPLPSNPPKLPSSTATAAILAQQHRSESAVNNTNTQQDMNKGYLSFAEDATELTSKFFLILFILFLTFF